MKKYLASSLSFLFVFLFVSSCFNRENTNETNRTMGIAIVSESKTPAFVEYEGTFRSVAGVKNILSCYTSNGGYIMLKDGSSIMVSFDDDANVSNCENIKVTGHYISKDIDPDNKSPCRSGSLRFLKVESFECW